MSIKQKYRVGVLSVGTGAYNLLGCWSCEWFCQYCEAVYKLIPMSIV